MNVVLTLFALNRRQDAEREIREVIKGAPGVLYAASKVKPNRSWNSSSLLENLDILEDALELMKGNRSSSIMSYFSPDGKLRLPVEKRRLAGFVREVKEVILEM